MPAFNIGKGHHLGNVAVSAANEIVIPGASHAAAIMRVMGDENAPPAQFQCRIHSVVNKFAGGFGHQIMDGHRIAKIVAMYNMDGKAKLERSAQGMGTYHITAMYNCLRSGCMGCGYCRGKWFGAVMTVGNDADFQFYLP
jgi:hypothetical protein